MEIKEWKVTDKRYVGFIDIMGFKDMVMRSTHNEVYKMMKKIEEQKKLNAEINWLDPDSEAKSELIRTTNYSDSIIIYSKDKSYASLYSFLCVISGISSDLFMEKIPHKGAFAYGTMTLDTENSIFFGQPLIDAFLLQEEVNFYGIVGHASAEKQIDTDKTLKKLYFLKKYLCPFKIGNSIHLTVFPMYVTPTSDKDKEAYKKERDKLFKSIDNLRHMTSGHLRKYIDNTEAYMKFIREN